MQLEQQPMTVLDTPRHRASEVVNLGPHPPLG
jgi:hypothetical protein